MCFWATFLVGAGHFGKVGKACTHNNHFFQSYYLISINGGEELYSYIFKRYLRVSIYKELDRISCLIYHYEPVIITPPHTQTWLLFFLHLFQHDDDDHDHCHFQTLRAHGCTKACLFLLKGHLLFNLLLYAISFHHAWSVLWSMLTYSSAFSISFIWSLIFQFLFLYPRVFLISHVSPSYVILLNTFHRTVRNRIISFPLSFFNIINWPKEKHRQISSSFSPSVLRIFLNMIHISVHF